MSEPEYGPKDSLDQKLRKQEEKILQDVNFLVDRKMDYSIRKKRGDWGRHAETELKELARQKAGEITEEIKKISQRQTTEATNVEEKMLLDLQSEKLRYFLRRFKLVLQVVGDEQISTDVELNELRMKGMALLQNLDVQTLVYEKLPRHFQGSYEIMLGSRVPKDYLNVLETLENNKPLGEEDWQILVDQVEALEGKSVKGMQRSIAGVLLSYLPEEQRIELLRRIQHVEHYEIFVLSMVATNYVTTAEAVQVLEEEKSRLDPENKDHKARLDALEEQRCRLTGEAMERIQNESTRFIQQGVERMNGRGFGHKNRAKNLFTVRGLGALLLKMNGTLTLGANIAAHITEPLNIIHPGNLGTWSAVMMLTAGRQLDRGGEGLTYYPEQRLAKWDANTDEANDDLRNLQRQEMKNEVLNKVILTRCYATYAEEILSAYQKKRKSLGESNVSLSCEEMGIDYARLPQELRDRYSKSELEKAISNWERKFYETWDEGMGIRTEESQRNWIQNLYLKRTGNRVVLYPKAN